MMSSKVKVALRILVSLLLLIAFGIMGVFLGYNYVLSQESRFSTLQSEIDDGSFDITKDTEGVVSIVVETGDDTSDIAKQLYDNKLIDNTFVFSLMSKVNGFDGAYIAGTHFLIPGLTYDEIMYLLTLDPESVTITFPEGMTYTEIKETLHEAGLTFSDDEMDELMDSPNLFVDYDFVSQIVLSDGRDYVLSGYLFPDTYEFDINADPETIINTFLNNTEVKLYDEYYSRAASLGMTMDQIMTLASIIQVETNNALDMTYVSAVFHNRLESSDESMHYLGSDATINYLREMEGLEPHFVLTDEDLAIDSPYNTYANPGLPPGPICMPGLDAIQAALYPEPNCNYYYFCATGDGSTVFAVTAEEQQANIAQYQATWVAIDEQNTTGETTTTEQTTEN